MRITKITREKLYRREYNDNMVVTIGNGGRFGAESLDGLAKILSIMVKEGSRIC